MFSISLRVIECRMGKGKTRLDVGVIFMQVFHSEGRKCKMNIGCGSVKSINKDLDFWAKITDLSPTEIFSNLLFHFDYNLLFSISLHQTDL